MVTTNPARILKWDDAIGSIEAGKRADLIVLDDTVDDPYERLLAARETAMSMVVINGVPRYGAPALLGRFGAESEPLQVGGTPRSLFLTDPDSDERGGRADTGRGPRPADRRPASACPSWPRPSSSPAWPRRRSGCSSSTRTRPMTSRA